MCGLVSIRPFKNKMLMTVENVPLSHFEEKTASNDFYLDQTNQTIINTHSPDRVSVDQLKEVLTNPFSLSADKAT